MAEITTPDYPRGVTFEQVWATLQGLAEQQKETDRILKVNAENLKNEFDRMMKENAEAQAESKKETDRLFKETDRKMKENAEYHKEVERQMKESAERLDRQLGKLGNRFGEVIEYMVMPNLLDKFSELGFVFEKAYHHAKIKDKKNNIVTEVDVTLENGDYVMLVEVKAKPTTSDINEHVERMGKVRAYADLRNDRRKFLAAIAGVVINDNEREYALKNGFYVIEPSGETFIITLPEGVYSPREW